MKLIINIPEDIYEHLKAFYSDNKTGGDITHEAVAYGIPLPEHYGRLIDADELKTVRSIQNKYANFNSIKTIQEWIDHAPTIIEADKGE